MDNYKLSRHSCRTRIGVTEISEKYNRPQYWGPRDRWHELTTNRIAQALRSIQEELLMAADTLILNLGSGGKDYDINVESQVHIDVAVRRLIDVKKSVLADINYLPVVSGAIDVVICVGGALNYVNPYRAIPEICRTAKSGAHIVLEFESSKSLEFPIKTTFGQPMAEVVTFYNGSSEKIYVYSEEFIASLLAENGVYVKRTQAFHILSSLAFRFSRNENTAQRWARLDSIARAIPGLRGCGSNVMLLAQKNSRTSTVLS
jgi:hypothetical protein